MPALTVTLTLNVTLTVNVTLTRTLTVTLTLAKAACARSLEEQGCLPRAAAPLASLAQRRGGDSLGLPPWDPED